MVCAWLLAAVVLVPQEAVAPEPEARGAFVVIVHAEHEGTVIRRSELADIFLGRATRWGDRSAIESVDQSLRSPVRDAFCREVLGLEPRAVLQYWQGQLQRGSGLRPPPVKGSDAEVIEWVGGSKGRIGYVGREATLPGAVKPIRIVE